MIINRPILHSFDIFDLIYSTVNCNTGNRLLQKIFNGLKTMLDKKNLIAYAQICGMCANTCEFLDMRHNFRICDFESDIICGKICDMRVLIAYNHHP